jgi:DNA polymerase-4
MRKPDTIERLYLDFDGFFAAVEEQARPALRGKPIGVTPFEHTTATCIIAANRMAKDKGVKTTMSVRDARRLCPDIQLVPQSPDLYERAHRKLLVLIENEIPIDAVCSIDELTCKLEPQDIADPYALSARIKSRLEREIGPFITCSIGIAPNRQLAKIASDMDKPNGLTILRPEDLPGRLLDLQIDDIPGVGGRMRKRLIDSGIWSVESLWNSQPKQLRALWGNVTGERVWYALRGYDVQADPTQRAMFGHGRVLPPEWRDFDHAFDAARLLTIKAARRLRRGGYIADTFGLWLKMRDDHWSGQMHIGGSNDDHAAIGALGTLWKRATTEMPASLRIIRLHVALYDLTKVGSKQFDIFDRNEAARQKWTSISDAMDKINGRYAKTIVSMGPWTPPPGGYAGGKIAFSRVPDMEDFW